MASVVDASVTKCSCYSIQICRFKYEGILLRDVLYNPMGY